VGVILRWICFPAGIRENHEESGRKRYAITMHLPNVTAHRWGYSDVLIDVSTKEHKPLNTPTNGREYLAVCLRYWAAGGF